MSASLEGQKIPTKKWIDFISPLVESHNSAPAYGTSFKRNEIKDSNFHDYLDERELKKIPKAERAKFDVTATFNSQSIDSGSLPDSAKRKLFKFLPGEEVLVSRKALKINKADGGVFAKSSVLGSFSRKRFQITSAKLRPTAEGQLVAGSYIFLKDLYTLNHP